MPNLSNDEVMQRILQHVPGCPAISAKLALKDTLYDFYEYTLVYQATLDPVATVVSQPTYPLVLPVGYQVIQAMSASLNHIPLVEKSSDALDLHWNDLGLGWQFSSRQDLAFSGLDEPTWREATADQPRFFHFESDGSVRLVGIPTTTRTGVDGLIVRAALKPIVSALVAIDDNIWNDNYQTIVAGTLERLMVLPKKPWSDIKLAGYWGGQYSDGRDQRRAWVLRNDTRNDRQNLRTQACP